MYEIEWQNCALLKHLSILYCDSLWFKTCNRSFCFSVERERERGAAYCRVCRSASFLSWWMTHLTLATREFPWTNGSTLRSQFCPSNMSSRLQKNRKKKNWYECFFISSQLNPACTCRVIRKVRAVGEFKKRLCLLN